ncbi:hypothetical protein GX656_02810 [Candidatus Dojkabacteria bacterium]|uniref:Uncharacterized protein n=1 Tax=Candidatus Dojkabacteria bacterium TaxID=2099670 RepID=A0A847CZZ4_9BACT|nr:hypothetical protein [Candidatus Dojkabacteria bacterium]
MGDAYKTPSGFSQDPSGLITPERLRRPSAEIQITGSVDGDMFKTLIEDLSKMDDFMSEQRVMGEVLKKEMEVKILLTYL